MFVWYGAGKPVFFADDPRNDQSFPGGQVIDNVQLADIEGDEWPDGAAARTECSLLRLADDERRFRVVKHRRQQQSDESYCGSFDSAYQVFPTWSDYQTFVAELKATAGRNELSRLANDVVKPACGAPQHIVVIAQESDDTFRFSFDVCSAGPRAASLTGIVAGTVHGKSSGVTVRLQGMIEERAMPNERVAYEYHNPQPHEKTFEQATDDTISGWVKTAADALKAELQKQVKGPNA